MTHWRQWAASGGTHYRYSLPYTPRAHVWARGGAGYRTAHAHTTNLERMELEWRQWRRRSLFLVTCGSVLAGKNYLCSGSLVLYESMMTSLNSSVTSSFLHHTIPVFVSNYIGTLLFWYLRHRRRWSLPAQSQSNLTRSQGRSTKLRHYSLSHCTIDVIDSGGACEEILQSKTPQSLHVIGLDCEWVNKERGGRSPVALLQLAFLDGHCLLVRLCKTNEIPSTLLDILQDNRSGDLLHTVLESRHTLINALINRAPFVAPKCCLFNLWIN